MRHSRSRGVRGRLALSLLPLLLLAGVGAAWAAEVETVVAPPLDPVRAGREALVRLFAHNHGDREAVVRLAETLRYRLVQGATRLEGRLVRREPAADELVVPPRGFARALYAFTPPDRLEGETVLHLPDLPIGPLLLSVAPPPAEAVAALPETLPTPAPELEPLERLLVKRFAGHEPMYFLVGVDPKHSKFQLSLRFQLFDFARREGSRWDLLNGLNFAYTQTSFWDLRSESKPFLDSSYKPEIFYGLDDTAILPVSRDVRWGVRGGVLHESNGKGGADSRSINIAYVRPRLFVGDLQGLYFELAPRAWGYLGGLDENPGIHRYRGYADLLVAAGMADGLRVALTYRQGTSRSSFQVDATYPVLKSGVTFFLHAQYFSGYAESLLRFDQKSEAVRLGFSVVR